MIEHLTLEVAFIEIDPFGASLVHIDDFGVIETEQTKDRGMQIVDVNLVFDRMQTEFVGFADDLSAFTPPPAIHMVKPVGLWSRSSPFSLIGVLEFSTPDDQRLVQRPRALRSVMSPTMGRSTCRQSLEWLLSILVWLSHLLPAP